MKKVAIALGCELIAGIVFGAGIKIGMRVTGKLVNLFCGKEELGKITVDMQEEKEKDDKEA